MDAIMWNARSVNTKQAFERPVTMHRQHHFEFIGFMEPMQQARKLERYRMKIGFAQAIANVSNKIWAFIDEVFEVTILYDMVQQLILRLFHTETHVELILTMVYAKCDAIERIKLWDSLYAMARDMTVPCLVSGDFNVIWDEEETFGGLPVSLDEVDDFRHCINTCNLTDLGFKGSIYTWWNGRAEEDLKKSFRFLNFWVKHDSFKDVVCENWHADFTANPFIIFNYKLKKLKKALPTWSKATYGDIFQKIASLEKVVMVHKAQFEEYPTQLNRERLRRVHAELIRYLALEEEFWKQKSGMQWFKDSDRNTKFFHA
nr:uncharacterized protein LOC104108979 [Nicotiana tomentosiformis]